MPKLPAVLPCWADQSDEQLMLSSKADQSAAFDVLMLRHQSLVYNFLLKMLGNSESALDLTQEVFFNLWKNRERYQVKAKFSTYLYRIVMNAAIDEINRLKRQKLWQLDPSIIDKIVGQEIPNAEKKLIQQEKERAVRIALLKLSDKFRSILILNIYQDLNYQELAEILKCSIGTVKSRLARAKLALYKILQEENLV